MIKKIFQYFFRHKILSGIIIILVFGGAYLGYNKYQTNKKSTEVKYVVSTVKQETIISSISGTGQVSDSNQVDIKSKVSGDIISVNVKSGQAVKAGDVVATIDSKEAQKSVRSAQTSLNSAKLSLEKMKRGSRPEEVEISKAGLEDAKKSVTKAEESLVNAQNKAETDLLNTYEDTKSLLRDSYNKADDILNRQIDELFVNNTLDNTNISFQTVDVQSEIDSSYKRTSSREALKDLKNIIDNFPSDYPQKDISISRANSDLEVVRDFLIALNKAVNAGIVSNNFSSSDLDSYKSTVNSAKTSINSAISSIDTKKQTIKNQKISNSDNLLSASNKVEDAKTNVENLQRQLDLKIKGNDPLDIKSQELSVKQKENDLYDAIEKLSDYTIKTPMDGIVAKVSVGKGNSVSSGTDVSTSVSSGTAMVTIVTGKNIASISLNEVDVAKVKMSQKATVKFDALSDLNITGEVLEVDSIGTVSQGVVSYNVKIGFDTQDERIKSGMSVSANIILEAKQDILTVPNSAIKTQNDVSYVEIPGETVSSDSLDNTSGMLLTSVNKQQEVEIGISNDTSTEIVSGLKLGDQIITKTITGSTAKTTTKASSLFPSTGGGASRAIMGGAH